MSEWSVGKIAAWAASITTIIGSVAALTWGVPYYIRAQVQAEVAAIAASQGTPENVVILATEMENLKSISLETREDVQFLREKMLELLSR
jgi:hypothetical protein